MNGFIKRELNKCRSEIVESLLQKHNLGVVHHKTLLPVLSAVLVEFNTIVGRLENINLEALRRQLRREYASLGNSSDRRNLPATVAEYVAAHLPVRVEREVCRIIGELAPERAAESKAKNC
jgi:hypothetical protein